MPASQTHIQTLTSTSALLLPVTIIIKRYLLHPGTLLTYINLQNNLLFLWLCRNLSSMCEG